MRDSFDSIDDQRQYLLGLVRKAYLRICDKNGLYCIENVLRYDIKEPLGLSDDVIEKRTLDILVARANYVVYELVNKMEDPRYSPTNLCSDYEKSCGAICMFLILIKKMNRGVLPQKRVDLHKLWLSFNCDDGPNGHGGP